MFTYEQIFRGWFYLKENYLPLLGVSAFTLDKHQGIYRWIICQHLMFRFYTKSSSKFKIFDVVYWIIYFFKVFIFKWNKNLEGL